MEAVLIFVVALLVWKAMAINEKIEHVDARLNNIDTVLAAYYKMLKELQPKPPVEIPARLDDEIVREMIPYFKRFQAEQDKKYQAPELDDFMYEVPEPNEDLSKAGIEYRKNKLEDDAEKEYLGVLKSGMFWEWYPQLTGVWKEDRVKWLKIYNDLTLFRAKYKEEQEYAATEGSALHYISKEEARMIAENIQERKKRSLNK
jgi:hypothetical protein